MTRAWKISASLMTLRCGIPGAADAEQDHLTDDGGRVRQVGCLEDVDELVHLLDDLGAEAIFDVDRYGHARELGVESFGDREGVDVVAAGGEHAGDAEEGSGFVFEKDGYGLQHWKPCPRGRRLKR